MFWRVQSVFFCAQWTAQFFVRQQCCFVDNLLVVLWFLTEALQSWFQLSICVELHWCEWQRWSPKRRQWHPPFFCWTSSKVVCIYENAFLGASPRTCVGCHAPCSYSSTRNSKWGHHCNDITLSCLWTSVRCFQPPCCAHQNEQDSIKVWLCLYYSWYIHVLQFVEFLVAMAAVHTAAWESSRWVLFSK